jgi:hypothetical protein
VRPLIAAETVFAARVKLSKGDLHEIGSAVTFFGVKSYAD